MSTDDSRKPSRACWWISGLAVPVLALAGTLAVLTFRPERSSPVELAQSLRLALTLPAGLALGSGSDYPFGLALAPDSRRLAYSVAARWSFRAVAPRPYDGRGPGVTGLALHNCPSGRMDAALGFSRADGSASCTCRPATSPTSANRRPRAAAPGWCRATSSWRHGTTRGSCAIERYGRLSSRTLSSTPPPGKPLIGPPR